jgi:protein ImuB
MHKPRAPLTARFGTKLLLRLDQALGHVPEPLAPVSARPRYHTHVTFVEPIQSTEHILEAVRHLLRTLTIDLARDGVGARTLRLLLSRVDGDVATLDVGLAEPSRSTEHVIRLFALRLDRLSRELETDFGFEAAVLHVLVAEPMPERQPHLCPERGAEEELTQLVDRFVQRLGANAMRRLHPYQSHIPERSVIMRPPLDGEPDWTVSTLHNARPLLVLPRPEPADVMALVPEGPPRQFRWRGVRHQVTHAEGPERIAPEWWRQERSEAVRDYYVVEDEGGRRFWLYRAGLYREAVVVPRWFVHGVFA